MAELQRIAGAPTLRRLHDEARMHRTHFRFALLLIAIAIAACNHRVEAPQLGVYRAVLRLPGGDTPFGFEVSQEQQQYVLYLKNGTERTRVSNVKICLLYTSPS